MPKPAPKPYRFSTPSSATARAKTDRAAGPGKMRYGFFAIAAVAAFAFASAWSPPAGKVHSFTNASDYRADRESGCTNSGEGCHGKETAYRDFNAYHPNAECTTCHDYDGVGCIPCHSPKNHECPVCHDGTMKQAPDRVRITDPYPRGHYRETTHTAMGTDFANLMPAVAGGKAAAPCKACHSRDLMGSHLGVPIVAGSEYGDSIGCGECHNDVRSFGLAEVKSDWKDNTCEACHRLGSSSPMHRIDIAGEVEGESPKGCGETGQGCHSTNDLHAVHPDAPKNCSGSAEKGEPGCHDLELQAHKPETRSCGGGTKSCHAAYTNDTFSHKRDQEVHSPEGLVPASDSSFFGIPCGECHWMEPDGSSLVTEHSLGTSTGSSSRCMACHAHDASTDAIENDWAERDGTGACSACHGRSGLDAAHSREPGSLHVSEDSAGCAETGDGCHLGSDLFGVGEDGLHRDCLRCHDKSSSDGNVAYDPAAKSCGTSRACHEKAGEYDPATSVHDGAAGRVDGTDSAHRATKLFSASMEDSATGLTLSCTLCHSNRLGTEHARANSAIAKGAGSVCIRCHSHNAVTASVVIADWPGSSRPSACDDCHSDVGTGTVHARIESVHKGRELDLSGAASPGACADTGCHTTSELRVLHTFEGCTTAGCHQSTGNILGSASKSCGGPAAGSTCHAGYSGLTGHTGNALSHGGVELDLLGTPASGFCVRSGCHISINLKTLHGESGCIVEGCHKPGTIIGKTSCGGTDAAAACHIGFTEKEHFVDHAADRVGTVDGITYTAGRNGGCFGCHNADVTVEHTGTEPAPITGGGTSNCRVCHYASRDPGTGDYSSLPSVSGAVASKDFRCLTCHASGAASPGNGFAASPHKRISTSNPLEDGFVWSDPAADWLAAFASPVGGGHNVTAYAADPTKRFPITAYTQGSTIYTWSLPPNNGITQWLRSSAVGGAPVGTETQITAVTVTCEDCHVLDTMDGPHGAAVPVAIDPAYSQTEYANPSATLRSQFRATGTDRVVCMKCHTLEFGSVVGTDSPGGAAVHAQHAEHLWAPVWSPRRYGERCVDCHVRVPHAWKSPRLLVRTVPEDGRPADAFPYVTNGHDGLAGVLLKDIGSSADLGRDACASGGCHGIHSTSNHPSPSDIPSAKYWP